jgi:hypothetical protein
VGGRPSQTLRRPAAWSHNAEAYGLRKRSGSFAILAAIRRASSRLSSFAACGLKACLEGGAAAPKV